MPSIGYKQTENHKKLLSIRAKARGNNMWLGRKHRVESIAKMRGPKSIDHCRKMSVAALNRWRKNKPQWYIKPVNNKPEPVKPQVYEPYHDIYMEEGWEGIKDII